MTRWLWLAAAALAALFALPSTASAAGFSYGVTAADVGQRSALVWTRANKAGRVRLEVSRTRRLRRGVTRRRARATQSNDRTVRVKLRGLRPGTRYYYRFRQGKKRRSAVGRFVTAPRTRARKTFTFAYSGDADATPERGESVPFYNRFQVYGAMAREGNAFNINLGDTIYSDSEVGAELVNGEFEPRFTARTVRQKWAKYRQNLRLANLRRVRARTAMFNSWDDHEFINDFSMDEHGRTLYNAGVRAFQDYMPVTRRRATGIYRKVRWGANGELYFLDDRSFRSAKAGATGVCDNPETKSPDLAPTAPQEYRDRFAPAYPPLRHRVSPACLAAIRSPSRTLLGAAQLRRFTNDVAKSTARWKIVINQVPIQQFYLLPYDRWEGYEFERRRVLQTLARARNTVVLSTDSHGTFYNDARYRTLEPGGPVNSGVNELVTGPVGTLTYEKEIDEAVGRDGLGDAIDVALLTAPSPDGIGMRCGVFDTYSYTQVRVTRSTLTLRPKNQHGRPLRDDNADRAPCGPFTLRFR